MTTLYDDKMWDEYWESEEYIKIGWFIGRKKY